MQVAKNFNEIQHKPLQAYNRVVMATNLRSDAGEEAAIKYMSQFSPAEKKAMFVMLNFVKKYGVEKAQKAATAGLEFEDVANA